MRLVAIVPPSYDAQTLLRERAPGIDFVVSEDRETLRREISDAEIALVAARHGRLLGELWPNAGKLRWVHSLGAGIDTLMFPELIDSNVVLTNSRGVFADALGEFAMAAILWFAKDLRRLVKQQAEHLWKPYTHTRIEGQTVGIIGFGGIGRAVARRSRAFGMHVVGARRTGQADALADRMYDDIRELVAVSDYVVICTPLTAETRGLVSADVLGRLKPDAVVINIGRGAVVDEVALTALLARGAIRGAALDVFHQEPLPPDHPLWRLENVLLSPHTADHVADSHSRAMAFFVDNLKRYLRGEMPLNVVLKSQQY